MHLMSMMNEISQCVQSNHNIGFPKTTEIKESGHETLRSLSPRWLHNRLCIFKLMFSRIGVERVFHLGPGARLIQLWLAQ